ncbi:hypothetical protein EVAR_64951_1 [Eumeta japonica]|uniref:Uncharacterized protein n=1 Tax=Eumeta variegata TaxID=151549 RepID=A0A4C1ZD28_EUMVA|nr:hypothetical protein EVAR_64951_1 [Eumeta japonica]
MKRNKDSEKKGTKAVKKKHSERWRERESRKKKREQTCRRHVVWRSLGLHASAGDNLRGKKYRSAASTHQNNAMSHRQTWLYIIALYRYVSTRRIDAPASGSRVTADRDLTRLADAGYTRRSKKTFLNFLLFLS